MKPIPASTVLLTRDGVAGIEVVMGLRPNRGAFGGVWVFPGGAVDSADREAADSDDEAWRIAALRELAEETGIFVTDPPRQGPPGGPGSGMAESGLRYAADSLVYLSNWVTPRPIPKRFDTRFYLCVADFDVSPEVVSSEFEEVLWVSAADALARRRQGTMPMIFPTVAHLKYLRGFATVAGLVAQARSLDRIPQIEPRLFERGDDVVIEVTNDPRFMS